MDEFKYIDGRLICEELPATRLARRFGTPLYVYSRRAFATRHDRLLEAFGDLAVEVRYSVKSCSNVHICRLLRDLGSGFDVVSGGELYRVLQAGADPGTVVFAGVGKSATELLEALRAGVGLLVTESEPELELVERLACQFNRPADVLLRVNPDVDAGAHRYTTTGRKGTKFGLDAELVPRAARRCMSSRWIRLRGLHVHIGSPILDVGAYRVAVERVADLLAELPADEKPRTIDIGGGFAVDYGDGSVPAVEEYARAAEQVLRGAGLRVLIEPGRFLAANSGVLLTRVLRIKSAGAARLAVVDASMNELIRPALYDSYHFIWPAECGEPHPVDLAVPSDHDGLSEYDVAGPVCESSDYLARGRRLPELRAGDVLAVFSAGAYGMSMASQYNSRPRPAEVLVDGSRCRLIRRRETYADLLAAEEELR